MKSNFKFYILSILLPIVVFAVYSCNKDSQTKTQSFKNSFETDNAIIAIPGESCFNSDLPCDPITERFDIQGIPGFSCLFRIDLTYCIDEPVPNLINITMSNYQIIPFGTNCCNIYEDSLAYFQATPSEADDVAFVARLDKIIIEKLENYLFLLHGGNIGCNNSFGQFSIAYVKQACNTICYIYVDPNDKTGDGLKGEISSENRGTDPPRANTFIRANCSTQGCCRRETIMCYNPQTNTVVKTTTNLVYPSSVTPENACAGGSIQYPTLPPNVTIIKCLNCTFSCNQ